MQKHNDDTIKMSRHSSLEKYTSHFIWKGSKGLRKVLSVRGELETEQNCNILSPQLFWLQQHFFPVLLGCSTEGLCWDMVLIPASSLQLIWTSCRRGYIIIWRPPTSCECHNSHSIQPFDSQGCPLIFLDRMHLLFTQVHFFFDSPDGSEVNMLQ